jgi:hypothetical protein
VAISFLTLHFNTLSRALGHYCVEHDKVLNELFSLYNKSMYCKAKEELGSPNNIQPIEYTAKVMYGILSAYLHYAK